MEKLQVIKVLEIDLPTRLLNLPAAMASENSSIFLEPY